MRVHYFLNVVIVFIASFILRDGYQYSTDWSYFSEGTSSISMRENRETNSQILADFLRDEELIDIDFSPYAETTAQKYTMGYFSVIVNEVTASGSLGFGILGGINKILFGGKVSESVTIFSMVVILALFSIFVKNIILIGRCRYFLERRLYSNVSPDRLLYIYKTARTFNTARIMLLRSIYQFLWNLTIIGGIIKHYEYMMIPYILAENPMISAKDAFRLSKELMRGDKRHAFWMEMSLLPGLLLDGLTFHLSSLFFTAPFQECLFAELYATVREEKRDGVFRSSLLCDGALFSPVAGDTYPDSESPTPFAARRRWMNTDYNQNYSILNMTLFFFLFSVIGWLFEVGFYLLNEGSFINRGTLTGPWLPIYGTGGLLIILFLKPLRRKPPLLFAVSFVMCGILEYATSYFLELFVHKRWWDYTGYFMNINGRVCLEGLTVFGLAGVAVTYFIAPVTDNLLERMSVKTRRIMAGILIALFVIDIIWTIFHPNVGNGITEGFY